MCPLKKFPSLFFFSKLESFNDAKKYRDKFRPLNSAVYNINRLVERPIPSLEPNVYNAANSTEEINSHVATPSTSLVPANCEPSSSHQNIETLCEQSFTDEIDDEIEAFMHNESSSAENLLDDELNSQISCENSQSSHDETDADAERIIQNETTSPEFDDVKNSFTPVQMENDESLAIDGLFNNTNNVNSSIHNAIDENCDDSIISPSLENVRLSINETAAINSKGQVVVTKIIDKDLSCVYVYGECPVPLAPFYKLKVNDLVTGNIPFKENVSYSSIFSIMIIFLIPCFIYVKKERKDRAYLVRVDGVFQEIKLSAQLMNGLILFNGTPRRENVALDKSFIKGLLIGVCTINVIRKEKNIHKDILAFIRELYMLRIENNDDNGSRYQSFNDLVNVSCMEIRANNFQ